jgi:hypothetical protein
VVSASLDFADASHKSGLNCKPDNLATSLLFYHTLQNISKGKAANLQSLEQNNGLTLDLTKAKWRFNVYAKHYSSFWDGNAVHNGNQGCEPIVFFPPLFPGLLECSKRVRLEYESLSTQFEPQIPEPAKAVSVLSMDASSTIKRKECETSEVLGVPNLKQLRVEHHPPSITGSATNSTGKADLLEPLSDTTSLSAPLKCSITIPSPKQEPVLQNITRTISNSQSHFVHLK